MIKELNYYDVNFCYGGTGLCVCFIHDGLSGVTSIYTENAHICGTWCMVKNNGKSWNFVTTIPGVDDSNFVTTMQPTSSYKED